jgi:uncharacterized damage-inducible protein DinB
MGSNSTAIFAKNTSCPDHIRVRKRKKATSSWYGSERLCCGIQGAAICIGRIRNVTPKAIQQETLSTKLIGRWEQAGQKLVALAEEVPENKFDYRPADGVRTLADVLRHVAFWNRYLADSARGKKGDDTTNELPKGEFSTKARMVDALRRSSEDASDALKRSSEDASDALKEHKSGLSPEMSEMVITFIEHNCEHYGQLVVYSD